MRAAWSTRGKRCGFATGPAGDLYALPIAVGDRVRLYGRTHARGAGRGQLGVNGSVLMVGSVEVQGLVLRSSSGREGLVPWAALRDRATGRIRLGHGDCLTLSAAQGATAEESILAMPRGSEGVGAAAFYVGLSRHRATSWLVLGEGGERRAVAARRGIGDARPIRAADLWSNAAASLSRRPGSEGALDLLDRAAAVRHAAEDGFRRGLARMERRAVQGLAPTILPAQGRRRRIAQALEPLIIKLAARAQALTRVAARVADLERTLADASPPRARMRRTQTPPPRP